MIKHSNRRHEADRMIVDGIAEDRPGTVRPLVRDIGTIFGGWGPRVV